MKRRKFTKREAKRLGITVERLREFHEITPCACGADDCKGWDLRYLLGGERRSRSA